MSGIPATNLRESGVHGVGPRTVSARVHDFGAFVSAVASGEPGGTYGVVGRYIVGGFADSVVIRANASRSARAAAAEEYVSGRDFPTDQSEGVGFWVDSTTSKTHLDVVRGYDSREEAHAVALANGEIAYWDRETDSEIRL